MTEAVGPIPPGLVSTAKRVAVCIATCRRPRMLERLLASLANLESPFEQDGGEINVIVVDNDPDGGARMLVEDLAANFPWGLTYLHEPIRNISVARNSAVRAARAWSADFVAFVDDDETAHPEWLANLLTAQSRFGADAVCGPVLPRFQSGTPRWVIDGGFFRPDDLPNGSVIPFGRTNNSLVATHLLVDDEVFHPGFGVSGGSDAQLFFRLVRNGARIVWSNDAMVEEEIPISRTGARWILMRALRVGQVFVLTRQSVLPPPRWRWGFSAAGGALARIVGGLVLVVPLGMLQGRAGVVRALRTIMHGVGRLSAFAGMRYHEYRRIHGG